MELVFPDFRRKPGPGLLGEELANDEHRRVAHQIIVGLEIVDSLAAGFGIFVAELGVRLNTQEVPELRVPSIIGKRAT